MEADDRDTEIFERIPWEALEKRGGERRWWVYLAAAALFMAGLGVTIGRSIASPTAPPEADSSSLVPTTLPVAAPPTSITTPSTDDVTSGTWAEADLMAASAPALETSAASLAEWFVAGYFTRDGSDGEGGRSFVDWAGPIGFEWVESGRAQVTVLVRRLAGLDEGPYQRLSDEAWKVVLALDEEGWQIVDGPFRADVPKSPVAIEALDSAVPDQVVALAGDETVAGARREGPDWLVEVDWTDEAGLIWPIRRLLPGGP